jgi:GR25 family glycosyltransferase involved in LPS biosynthesis
MNYVISLKRSKERRSQFLKENQNFDFSFFDAFDGAELSKKVIQDTSLFSPNLVYTKGAYGCALSHLYLWDISIEKNQIITIIEDDTILRDDFEIQKNIMMKQKSNWDIILWGWNFDHVLSLNLIPNISPIMMLFNQNQLRESTDIFKKETYESTLFPLDKTFGIPAYSISPKGALFFKEYCFPLQPFEIVFPLMNRKMQNNGIDIAMNRIYSSSRSFACFPPIAITKNEKEISTVQNNQYFK